MVLLANFAMLMPIVGLLLSSHWMGQNAQQPHNNNNSLHLKLFPGLAVPDTHHVYYVVGHCEDSAGIYAGGEAAFAEEQANDEAIVTLNFRSGRVCAYFRVYIWLLWTEMPNKANVMKVEMPNKAKARKAEIPIAMDARLRNGMNTWPAPYLENAIPNDGLNKRIMFGNFFNLTIGPALETSDLFYHFRVFCDEDKMKNTILEIDEEGKTVEKWTVSEDYSDYKFKTFTKGTRPTKVVFNSEQIQCDRYHIKVWATHTEWMDMDNTAMTLLGRPIAYFVCESKGNAENFQISLLKHFLLQIEPPLPKEEENVYFVEVQCHGFKPHTFKTIARAKTDVVLHQLSCKTYDISVRKVPLEWIRRLKYHGYNGMIHSTKPFHQLGINITMGSTHVLEFPARFQRPKEANYMKLNEGTKVTQQHTANEKQMAQIIEILDDDEEMEEEEGEKEENENEEKSEDKRRKKSEKKDDCYFYYNF
ncbi:hypothetical protein niasHS_001105 [Heterodera schachtii]|uniref:Uncharacterized protein n=1 Tax=Heterodera schachtii TaxID=97005 RepID=A0ABD2KDH5_HETSC